MTKKNKKHHHHTSAWVNPIYEQIRKEKEDSEKNKHKEAVINNTKK